MFQAHDWRADKLERTNAIARPRKLTTLSRNDLRIRQIRGGRIHKRSQAQIVQCVEDSKIEKGLTRMPLPPLHHQGLV